MQQGNQTAFLLCPASGSAPRPQVDRPIVIAFFGGNAATALDWLAIVQMYRWTGGPSTHLLFFDSPGYGLCDGRPGSTSILESTKAAMDRVAKHLQVPLSQIRLRLVGHSIGSAAALQYASSVSRSDQPPIEHMLLLSPFQSMLEIAHYHFPRLPRWLLGFCLRHPLDNEQALQQLVLDSFATRRPLSIHIFHGSRDSIVPCDHGRLLADHSQRLINEKQHSPKRPVDLFNSDDVVADSPVKMAYSEFALADHNDVFIVGRHEITDVLNMMAQELPASPGHMYQSYAHFVSQASKHDS